MKLNPTAWLAAGSFAAFLVVAPGSARAQRPAQPSTSRPAAPPASATAPQNGAPVTLRVQGTPLRTALEMLFTGSGLQLAIEPGVPDLPITLSIHGIPFDTALRTLLRLAPGVTYRKEGEIYIVGMRPPAPTTNVAEPAAPAGTAAVSEEEVVRIPINYIHPAILAYILNGRLIPTEDQFQPGIGGYGGYGGGFGGVGGLGGYGGITGGGLGAAGYGSFGSGNLGSLVPVYGPAGVPNGLASNVLVDPLGNSVVVAPQTWRF